MNPEKIGRYIIIAELGRGGMATVYHAKDPNFDRDVAIKILPRTFLHDPQFRVRFEREAKTIAALEHSSIVPVYDFGEDDGQPFIVMRLMTGGSLADKIANSKLSLEETVRILVQLSPGLAAAHQKGIIHRDLKPGNILFDQYDNAYLSDFGIARLTEGDSTLTGSQIIGTPAYMSPEQIQGGTDLDHRSDLYAMGVMFYQMLVGETPFQATTHAKVMMMHILEPVPNLLISLPSIPRSVEIWCVKVLAKEPDDRFQGANKMAEALEAAMQGQAPELSTKILKVPSWSDNTTRQRPPLTPPPPARQASPTPQPRQSIAPRQTGTPKPLEPTRPKRIMPIVITAVVLLGIGAIAIIALLLSGLKGKGPLAMLAQATATKTIELVVVDRLTNTPEPASSTNSEDDPSAVIDTPPTLTEAPPTSTPAPVSPTPEITSTEETLSIGGADKIAFLDGNDIWLMNVDGSDLQQMTNDGAAKTNLGWLPDGSAITYISGKCINAVDVESTRIDFIACFESTVYLENFSFSPDGNQVAISLNRELYIVPWDKEALQSVRYNRDLKAMSECGSLAPILNANNNPEPIKLLRWTNDPQKVIILKLANVDGILADLIQFYDLKSCEFPPIRIDEIPASRFTLEEYDINPRIQNFGFDGEDLLSLVSFRRNDGYGDLYIYNSKLHRADIKVNPINGECCYRDPQFSPDGRYLILVYQPYEADAVSQLYYIPFGTIGSGARYEPLPLPDDFFDNARVKPQPVLRPAK